jgi:glycine/D-amino acid oxidase-like deaminating enzyme
MTSAAPDAGGTETRRLRLGRTLWERSRLKALPSEALTHDVATDVVVVGAGISGALVTEALVSAGLRVRVVDRRGPALGSTIASTALLLYDTDTPLSQLSERMGRDRAERAWRRSRLAVESLRDCAARLDVSADIEDRPSLYLEGDLLDAAGLEAECRARRRAGFECELLRASDVEDRIGVRGRAALSSFGALTANPRRLAAGVLHSAIERGATLHTPVDVVAVDESSDQVRAITREGPIIRARHLVYATGHELPDGIPETGHRIASTWVIATGPQPSALWWKRCLIWEAADPYLYIRAAGRRIICGGEDEDFSSAEARDALLPEKAAALQARLGELMPQVDATPELAWAASFGQSPSGLPVIGQLPGAPRRYATMGFGGNGITFSMLGAQILRGLITGEGDADADLFGFQAAQAAAPDPSL